MKTSRPKAQQHRWGDRQVIDEHHTHYACLRCGLIRVTRHEPGERSWQEYRRDDALVARAYEATPACDARIEIAAEKAAADTARKNAVTNYWLEHYLVEAMCSLCGQHGVIDTHKSAITPAGLPVGRLHFCICPNGMAMRATGKAAGYFKHQRGTSA